jgi:nucleoside-diphosphate-sugar epimerase
VADRPYQTYEPTSRSYVYASIAPVQSAYSLSKLVGETIADQYVRWVPDMKILSYRFSNVIDVERESGSKKKESRRPFGRP